MRRLLFTVLAASVAATVCQHSGWAQDVQPACHAVFQPPCAPGYQIVEETVYEPVCKFCCTIVPDVKKKWVYCCVDDGFCFTHTPHHHGCEACPSCTTHLRKLLVKRQVDHCVGTKCVVEQTVELVPRRVCRQVPCASMPSGLPVVQGVPSVQTTLPQGTAPLPGTPVMRTPVMQAPVMQAPVMQGPVMQGPVTPGMRAVLATPVVAPGATVLPAVVPPASTLNPPVIGPALVP